MWEYRHTDELYHYGILGMRWGVRRYQNYDGSLTPAGREHYGVEGESYKKPTSNSWKYQESVDVAKAKRLSNQILNSDEVRPVLTPRAKEAAVTGLNAMMKAKIGDTTVEYNPNDYFDQDWFLCEDQTLGYGHIADLANQGYSVSAIKDFMKSASEIEHQKDLLYESFKECYDSNSIDPLDVYHDWLEVAPFDSNAIWELNEAYDASKWYGKKFDKYIEACVDYNKNKAKHSAIQSWSYTSTDELYHYGILGMKWGVRRYQNPDGSLTALGRMRYGTSENFNRVLAAKKKAYDYKKNKKAYERQARKNKAADEEIKRIKREAGMKVKEDKPKTESTSAPKKEKKISEMTNKEIQEKINRIQLEKQLRREMASLQVEKVSKGKAFVNKIVKMANNPILRTALINPVAQHVGNQISAELKKSVPQSKSDKLKKQAEDLKNEAFISNYRKQILENNKAINDHKKDPAYSAVFASLDKESKKDMKKQEKKDNTSKDDEDKKKKK